MAIKELIKGNEREVKDVFYLIALQGLTYLAPLLIYPYLMKVLGAEKFGYIGFSLAVCQYLMLFVDFGFNLSASKKIAINKNNRDELNHIFSSTLYAKLILLAISLIMLAAILLIPAFAQYTTTTIVMSSIIIANTFSFLWLFQGLGKIRIVSIINAITKILIWPLTFIFVRSESDFLIAATIQSLVYIAAAIITCVIIQKDNMVSLVKCSMNDIREQLKDSLPVFLSIAATSIYTASFVIILGYFRPASEVGIYSAAEKTMRVISSLVLVPILQAFYPKLSEMSICNRTMAATLSKKLLVFVMICMTIIGIVLFGGAGYITTFLGPDYVSGTTIFKFMAIIPFFVGTGGVMAQLVILALGGEKEKKNYRNIYLCAGIIALVSVFSLTPTMGSLGATISLLITELFVCILMTYYGILILRKII